MHIAQTRVTTCLIVYMVKNASLLDICLYTYDLRYCNNLVKLEQQMQYASKY